MRFALCAVLTVAMSGFISSTACAQRRGGEIELGLMTFNIRFATEADGDNAWSKRKDLVVETIEKYDPVILGLQECLDSQAYYLDEQMPQYRWFGIGRDRNGGGEMTPIFYKPDVVTPIETGTFWLSETPNEPASRSWDAAITRIVTWIRFFHPETSRFFTVYNTHYDHRGEEARANASRVLAEHIGELPADEPIIAMGDFNAKGGDSEPWQVLVDAGLEDTWLLAEEQVGPPVTFSRWTHPREGVDSRIDWIMVRADADVEVCETVLHNDDGRYPSDHYPVYARLTIRAKE